MVVAARLLEVTFAARARGPRHRGTTPYLVYEGKEAEILGIDFHKVSQFRSFPP
jgi:hypothetical protein